MSTAFIFPGQGSQSVGMLDKLYELFPEYFKQFFESVSESAEFDVWELIHCGNNELLNRTEYTQVAMLAADVLIHDLLMKRFPDLHPTVMAGHSLGEYAALVSSESMSIQQGIKIVRRRGQLMQQAIPLGEGAMAAIIGLEKQEVLSICHEVSNNQFEVKPANFNTTSQTVIAGHTKAVKEAITLSLKKNARLAKLIPVSVPCHCELLKDVSIEFTSYLSQFEFQPPKIPVISNVYAQPYPSTKKIIPLLTKQLYSPVLWVDSVKHMISNHKLSAMIEVGPGNVLSSLVKRIDRSLKINSAYSSLLSCQELTNQ